MGGVFEVKVRAVDQMGKIRLRKVAADRELGRIPEAEESEGNGGGSSQKSSGGGGGRGRSSAGGGGRGRIRINSVN